MTGAMGEDPVTRLAAAVGKACAAKGFCIATAESCTGGGIAEAITRIGGSSAWFDRAFVTYTNQAKQQMLGVSKMTLRTHGAVSEPVALEMALGAIAASSADLVVSVTGIAGPGGATEGKPVGTVCFGWARRNGDSSTETQHFRGDRAAVRSSSVIHALERILLISN